MLPIYVVIALVAIGYPCYYFFYVRRRKSSGTDTGVDKGNVQDKVKSQTPAIKARIYDRIQDKIYNATISGDTVDSIIRQHETIGRQWERSGEWLYALIRLSDGSFRPVYVPSTLDYPPSKLRRALTHPYVVRTWAQKKAKGLLQQYGGVLLFAGVVVVVLFLLAAKG